MGEDAMPEARVAIIGGTGSFRSVVASPVSARRRCRAVARTSPPQGGESQPLLPLRVRRVRRSVYGDWRGVKNLVALAGKERTSHLVVLSDHVAGHDLGKGQPIGADMPTAWVRDTPSPRWDNPLRLGRTNELSRPEAVHVNRESLGSGR